MTATAEDVALALWDRCRNAYVANLEGEGWGDVYPVDDIASAIRAAEERGVQRERERAAGIAESIDHEARGSSADAVDLANEIAEAIRAGGAK